MAGFTTNKGNFTQLNVLSTSTATSKCLAFNLWTDMINNGFSLIAMDNSSVPDSTKLSSARMIILQPSTDVDPLWATNNWYVAFQIVNKNAVIVNNNNTTSTTTTYTDTELQVVTFGWESTSAPEIQSTTTDGVTTLSIPYINGIWYPVLPGLKYPNQTAADADGNIYPRIYSQHPYAYLLTIVKRGFAFSIYDQTLDNMNYNGIYCVQRAVDKTGTMRSTGKTPLYCVTNVIARRRYFNVESTEESITNVPLNLDNIPTNNHTADFTSLNAGDLVSATPSRATQLNSQAPKINYEFDPEQGPGPTSTWMGTTVREVDNLYYPTEDFYDSFKYFTTYRSTGQSDGSVTNEDTNGKPLPPTAVTTVFYDEFKYAMISTTVSYPNTYTGKYLHRFPSFWDGPVTSDNGDYLLVLPYGLCSDRYSYTDEVDLIAVSKADAYQLLQQVPITLYTDNRTYSALSSNNELASANGHNGIRGFILVSGNDFTGS